MVLGGVLCGYVGRAVGRVHGGGSILNPISPHRLPNVPFSWSLAPGEPRGLAGSSPAREAAPNRSQGGVLAPTAALKGRGERAAAFSRDGCESGRVPDGRSWGQAASHLSRVVFRNYVFGVSSALTAVVHPPGSRFCERTPRLLYFVWKQQPTFLPCERAQHTAGPWNSRVFSLSLDVFGLIPLWVSSCLGELLHAVFQVWGADTPAFPVAENVPRAIGDPQTPGRGLGNLGGLHLQPRCPQRAVLV